MGGLSIFARGIFNETSLSPLVLVFEVIVDESEKALESPSPDQFSWKHGLRIIMELLDIKRKALKSVVFFGSP